MSSGSEVHQPVVAIPLDRCRTCFDGFLYSWNGWQTKVIAGIPRIRDYKAVSYVWGKTQPLPFQCLHCGHITRIPMESVEKFVRLMALTDVSGQSIWLDALSIDQSDHNDIATQMAVMGDIYSNARAVAVLLPKSDGAAYEILESLGDLANLINKRKLAFSKTERDAETEMLSRACQKFFSLIDEFEKNMDQWTYWRRAWTFQEWALSAELTLTWEGQRKGVNFGPFKRLILKAATTMAINKLRCGQFAVVDVGLSRAAVPSVFQTIQRLFPDEHAFIPPGTVDEKEARFDAYGIGFRSALGLRQATELIDVPCHAAFRLDAELPSSKEQRFLERFSMAMHALGVTKREARFEADLVASWASMCNIAFDYRSGDSFAVALQKVLKALRKNHGLTIHNFHVNTRGSSGEVDLTFLDYATAHRFPGGGYVYGPPIFTGRSDTVTHLRTASSQPPEMTNLKGSGVNLQRVKNSSIKQADNLTEVKRVVDKILSTWAGIPTHYIHLYDTSGGELEDVLSHAPPEATRKVLVMASIQVKPRRDSHFARKSWFRRASHRELACWAICPADTKLSKCFVAREALNGTLVIASHGEDRYRVVAYLTITDKERTTYLVKMDKRGVIDMRLPDLVLTLGDVHQGSIEKDTLVAF